MFCPLAHTRGVTMIYCGMLKGVQVGIARTDVLMICSAGWSCVVMHGMH